MHHGKGYYGSRRYDTHWGPLVNLPAKTCATCVHSTSPDPKCGLCAGPTEKTSRYQPIPVKKD